MNEVFYRTGQAAKLLGISTYHLRRLCEAALVEHELTPGGHHQIPGSEIQRLERDGIPPIPQMLDDEDLGSPSRSIRTGSNYAEPPREDPSEDVIRSAEEVKITENRILKRRLELEAEELEDRFRERAEKEEETEVQRHKEMVAREVAEEHRRRIHQWMEVSLEQVPSETPRAVQAEVCRVVEEALVAVSPDYPDRMIRNVVDAAVERALNPWRRKTQMEQAVQKAREQLPREARGLWRQLSKWDLLANQKANAAITALREGATIPEIEAAARQAGEEVKEEFEHEQACQDVVRWTWMNMPREANSAEQEQGKEAVRKALENLPVGASRQLLESAQATALRPLKRTIEQRERQRKAQDEAESKRLSAEITASLHISEVDEYLSEEFEFEDATARYEASQKLKKQIQPLLAKQLLRQQMSHEEIQGFIRNRVDERM